MAKNHKVSVELSTEATLQLFMLEGYVISLTRTLDNVYRIVVHDFPIEGDLDYYVHCTGWNKTPWTLKILLDDKEIMKEPVKGEIKKGYSAIRGAIQLGKNAA